MKATIGLLMLLCEVVRGLSDVPQQINYQGFLTRADGTALDTVVAVQFALCDDSVCTNLLWSENHPVVTVAHGLFNVRLGELTAFPGNLFDLHPNL